MNPYVAQMGVVRVKAKRPVCAYCSMPGVTACDSVNDDGSYCLVAMCIRHSYHDILGSDKCLKHRAVDVDLEAKFLDDSEHGAASAQFQD